MRFVIAKIVTTSLLYFLDDFLFNRTSTKICNLVVPGVAPVVAVHENGLVAFD